MVALCVLIALTGLGVVVWHGVSRRECYPAVLFPQPINGLSCVRAVMAGPYAPTVAFIPHGAFTVAWRLLGSPSTACDPSFLVALQNNAIQQDPTMRVTMSNSSGLKTFYGGEGSWYVERQGICPTAANLVIAISY